MSRQPQHSLTSFTYAHRFSPGSTLETPSQPHSKLSFTPPSTAFFIIRWPHGNLFSAYLFQLEISTPGQHLIHSLLSASTTVAGATETTWRAKTYATKPSVWVWSPGPFGKKREPISKSCPRIPIWNGTYLQVHAHTHIHTHNTQRKGRGQRREEREGRIFLKSNA